VSSYRYSNEADGQADFFKEFGVDPSTALQLNTDGVHNGNLLEFKVAINDVNQVLFQAIKYLARLRVNGHNVPANILLVDLNALTSTSSPAGTTSTSSTRRSRQQPAATTRASGPRPSRSSSRTTWGPAPVRWWPC